MDLFSIQLKKTCACAGIYTLQNALQQRQEKL